MCKNVVRNTQVLPLSVLNADAARDELLLHWGDLVGVTDGFKLFQGSSKVIPVKETKEIAEASPDH